MFENFRVFETTFAGEKISFETGKMCGLSGASVLVRYGETSVLCNVTMSELPRPGIDFFPLSVDYEEKLYAVGKIPGSYMKRESRPSEKAILASRCVDRPFRPLFPSDMRNDVSIVMTVLSVDQDFSPEIAGMIGSSLALAISDIPWNGPVAGIQVAIVDDQLILNPTESERTASTLALTVVGTRDKICMIEAGASEIPEAKMMEAIKFADVEIKKMVQFLLGVQKEIGKTKIAFPSQAVDRDMFEAVKKLASDKIKAALDTDDKKIRDKRMAPITEEIHAQLDTQYPDQIAMIDECIYKLQKYIVRRWLLDEQKRVDGRGMDEIRPLNAEVGLIPRVHGTGLSPRGQTQVLTFTTIGPMSDAQRLDGLDAQENKRYMHQYNFPSYSVGETRPLRGPGRREIGHGALAERALEPVIPSAEEFPYAIRLVSEVLSSNGSTSQGSICASTLSLMDAGVPIKAPVAGISCGLITEGDRWMTMVDIQGLEDFFGDMDFKVGGTHKGITAIQMDIKLDGLSYEIIEDAFEKCRKARLYILDEIMLKALPEPRKELSKYAPRMVTIKIHPDKIREVIGSGGKVIQRICAENDVKMDIHDDGTIYILAMSLENAERACQIVRTITEDPKVGAFYKGKVVKIMAFGAFVEIAPGKEGLVHISKLDTFHVDKVEDVVSIGSEVVVKVTEIDSQGRINLSRRDALIALEKQNAEEN